jgi:hypothetical protein
MADAWLRAARHSAAARCCGGNPKGQKPALVWSGITADAWMVGVRRRIKLNPDTNTNTNPNTDPDRHTNANAHQPNL